MAFKALSAAFSWTFSTYVLLPRATVGMLAHEIKDEVFATNLFTLLVVASPRLTAEIHSFLLLAGVPPVLLLDL